MDQTRKIGILGIALIILMNSVNASTLSVPAQSFSISYPLVCPYTNYTLPQIMTPKLTIPVMPINSSVKAYNSYMNYINSITINKFTLKPNSNVTNGGYFNNISVGNSFYSNC